MCCTSGVVTVTGDRPPARRRTQIGNFGEPITGRSIEPITDRSIELSTVEGFEGEGPRKVVAYVLEADDISFVGLEQSGGPAPIDLPATEKDGSNERPRIGWSLVVAAISDTTVGVAAIASGSTLIGIASSIAVGICSIVLVASEAIAHFGRRRRRVGPDPKS